MEIFLVGGAVRDALLNLPVTERDWVVVGSSPEEMLALGYQPVGKDFPVFLHPITHEEYALARTERKIGKGYKGFTFHSDPGVTLIEDLRRRDLTINAIAQSSSGEIIDPYGGQEDLNNKILRHVSPAFQEDPVRILRLARFAAKFPEFTVHPDTLILMQNMVQMGEVNALVPERVWQEFSRALETSAPQKFLDVLKDSHAYEILFPEIKLTNDVCKSLQNAVEISPSPLVRFAVLLQHLDKKAIIDFGNRYRIPREYIEMAQLNPALQIYNNLIESIPPKQTPMGMQLVTRLLHPKSNLTPGIKNLYEELKHENPDLQSLKGIEEGVKAELNILSDERKILNFLKFVDSRRRPERFQLFLLFCRACTDPKNLTVSDLLQKAAAAINKIDTTLLQQKCLKGPEFIKQLEEMQLKEIRSLM